MSAMEDPPASTLFTLAAPGKSQPQSAEMMLCKLNTSLCVSEIYREHFLQCVRLLNERKKDLHMFFSRLVSYELLW